MKVAKGPRLEREAEARDLHLGEQVPEEGDVFGRAERVRPKVAELRRGQAQGRELVRG